MDGIRSVETMTEELSHDLIFSQEFDKELYWNVIKGQAETIGYWEALSLVDIATENEMLKRKLDRYKNAYYGLWLSYLSLKEQYESFTSSR